MCASLNPPSLVVAQLVCAIPCESDGDLELHQHVELGLRTQSRGSSREPAAERSGVAPRVFAGIGPGALSGGCTRTCVMLVVARGPEAAAPSRVHHEASVKPLSSVRGAV